MHLNRKFIALFLLTGVSALLFLSSSTVEAGWFKKKKDADAVDPARRIETYQPPPPDALETHCEPIRRKVLTLNRKPFVVRVFNRVRVHHLKGEHKACILGIKTQEVEYLRHVDEPQAPSLPPLKIDEAEAK